MFVYQPALGTLGLKEDEVTDYVIVSKSKGFFKSKLFPSQYPFLPNIKFFGYEIGIQFNNTALVL